MAGRQRVSATVVVVAGGALILRLPTGETIARPVGEDQAARWRRQLAHGPGAATAAMVVAGLTWR